MQALLSACLVLWVLGCATARDPTSPYTLTDAEIVSVQTDIFASQKDNPPTVRGLRAARSADGHVYVCGWMRSKNAQGLYTEEQPFIGSLFAGQFGLTRVARNDAEAATILSDCRERGIGI